MLQISLAYDEALVVDLQRIAFFWAMPKSHDEEEKD
jgi:hypothetical protein